MNYFNHPRVRTAAKAALAGQVLAYPTEAVWGLGCDPFNAHAVEKILQLKKRPVEKGLILVAASFAQLDFLLATLPEPLVQTLKQSWPGPHTWLVPHNNKIPYWVRGEHDTVAVRVSAHPLVQALCAAFGGPLISTSANPSGLAPARYGTKARQYFGREVIYVPGQVDHRASPSTIHDLITGQTFR